MQLTGVVANTDRKWFDHFRPSNRRTVVDEVNFWRPLAQHSFRALPVSGPLFFRLKAPANAIAGFGFFAGQYALSVEMAWDVFGAKNGDPTYDRFRNRIDEYRRRLRTGQESDGSLSPRSQIEIY